jgi:hypothetical protein
MPNKKKRKAAPKKTKTPGLDGNGILKVLNAKWALQKKQELESCYNGLADVCSKFPSIIAITALELVKAQIILAKLNKDKEPDAVEQDDK